MSQCVFIAADCPLPEVRPSQEYPLHINVDTGCVYDGDADDNYFLLPFDDVDVYCGKNMALLDGSAETQIMNYSVMEP